MVIAGSDKKEHYVTKLFAAMEEKKQIFTTMQPFQKFMEASGRSIWFVSHEDKFKDIEEVKKKIDKKNTQISFFSVNSHLELDLKEKTEMRLS